MILVADSGSTKTNWVLNNKDRRVARQQTRGINPFMMDARQIEAVIREDLGPAGDFGEVAEIHFYGAGCRGAQIEVVQTALKQVWPDATVITVESDLVGAARALFGEEDGVACILGTGSNSGLYLEGQIADNVSPLGFILGDEGSGAVLGRRFLGDLFKHQLPETVAADFDATYALTSDEVIRRVYREAMPNRFLASFAPFIHRHRHEPAVHAALVDEFTRFFVRNVAHYQRPDLPVSFVGSIAYYFAEELAEAAQATGYKIGRILREPLD